MLTTNQKGAIAETAIIHEATKLGLGVFKSIADERYDLIFDLNPELIRVQCKTASKIGSVVVVRCYSNRRTATGMLSRAYTAEEIDALAAYCPDLGRCYLVPAARIDGRRGIQLRLDPTRNNQQLGVNWARDWEFAATLRREFGAEDVRAVDVLEMPVLHQGVLDGAAHEPNVGVRRATGAGGVERAVREVPFDGTEHQEVRTR